MLVTSPDNPIDELTLEQVRKIFVGEYQNWKEVGGLDEPIVTMSRDDAVSGTEKFFREFVLKGFPFKQQTVRLFDADIATAVWKRKGSIADARYTEAIRGRIRGMVKIIAIKEDENSQAITLLDSLRSKFYPVSAPMFVSWRKLPHGRSQRFRGFLCSSRTWCEPFPAHKVRLVSSVSVALVGLETAGECSQ